MSRHWANDNPVRREQNPALRHGPLRHAAVVAGAAVVMLGPAVGVASASGGPVLSWSPTTSPGTYNYGTVTAGQKVAQVFTLTNSGSKATSALTVSLTGSAAFTKTADTCTGIKLSAGKSCSATVQYAPTTPAQTDSATLTATSKSATASLTLKGASAKASPALATSPSAGGTVGSTTVTDTATVSGGSSPGGTIEFKAYGPSPSADCSGTPVDDETVTVSGNGSYTTPAGFTPAQAGTYWWTASYSGDARNNPASSGCGTESVTISKASPAIATNPSQGGTVGAAVSDAAALAGSYNAAGTIEFKLYGPSAAADCSGTPVVDQFVPVSGDGAYPGPSFTPSQAGTYWWTARYSGDANNNPVASGCDQEQVTITKAAPALATSPRASGAGTVGSTTVTDTATLTGGSSPGGSIEFKAYGPSSAADCSGTPVDDETVTVSGNGSYTTPNGFTPAQAGTYWWTASYGGDTNNNQAATNCGGESVTITKASPAISTSPSQGGPVGTAATDTATLTGGSSPGGSIEFTLYGPSATADCSGTPVDDKTVTVIGNGSYTSPSFIPTQAGTYYWVASYSGDTNNNQAATNCGDEPVTITKTSPALSTNPNPATGPIGTVLQDTATLAGGFSPAGTVEFRLYATADCSGSPVDDEKVTVSGNGTYTTTTGYTAAAAGTYQWTAAYTGDPNNNPAATKCGDEPVTITSSAHLYWAEYGTGTIWEANLDGTNAHPIVSNQPGPTEVALNSSNLYWADVNAATIWEASLDGTNAHPIVIGQPGLTEVTLNSSNLYWGAQGAIWEANLDGTNAHPIVSNQPQATEVTLNSSNLYWANNFNPSIWEANLDGTNAHPIVIGQPPGLTEVTLNSSNLYWADLATGTIMEANLDGTNAHPIVGGQASPTEVTLNSSNLYWANRGVVGTPGTGTIMEANLDGTNAHPIVGNQTQPNEVTVGPQ